jgi:glycosyltransferase involved in cell wall biosynthesis
VTHGPVLFLLKGYPRLSETFIAQEILSLERAGLPIQILAMRHPTDSRVHPIHKEIRAPVAYLPEYLHHAPLRVLMGWWKARRLKGYNAARAAFFRDLPRDISRNRFRRFGQAMVLAAEIDPAITRIHAHFIHTPGSVARYAALLTGLPWSCSAHAKDIWTSADWELGEKLASATFVVTCTAAGQERLNALGPAEKPVTLSYHGLDLARFRPLQRPRAPRRGDDPADPVRLLTVARAVPKKGLDTLVAALALLPADLAWTWSHIGGGDTKALKRQAEQAGIAHRTTFKGGQDQVAVLAAYGQADAFVLPCRITADGDRDGLPNVLMEAASQGLPLVSSPVSDVGAMVAHDRTGLLVASDNAPALAAALERLIGDPGLRRRLGDAARRHVESRFDHAAEIGDLLRLFGLAREPAGS